uniref:DUF6821 domain-containing protein n=1 Tax=Ananas comosus var. bracteatus TaxID=296719 RepID=A0A6V7QRM3_ANACO
MEDWELLPDNLPRESYFNPTGLFEPNYFTPHESTQTDATEEIIEEKIEPPIAIAGATLYSTVGVKGAGALCSFGIAAAALLVIMDGKHQKRQMQQKLCFEIRTDDKKKINKLIEEKAKSGDGTYRAEIKFGGV